MGIPIWYSYEFRIEKYEISRRLDGTKMPKAADIIPKK